MINNSQEIKKQDENKTDRKITALVFIIIILSFIVFGYYQVRDQTDSPVQVKQYEIISTEFEIKNFVPTYIVEIKVHTDYEFFTVVVEFLNENKSIISTETETILNLEAGKTYLFYVDTSWDLDLEYARTVENNFKYKE